MVYEVKEINHVFQLTKGNEVVGVFRSEAALNDALKRLEAEEKQYWTVEDLESLTETVQEAEVKYQEKYIKISWCELTESEEPKALVIDDSLSEEEKNTQYLELAKERISAMMKKAQNKKPDPSVLSMEVYNKLPSSAKFAVTNKMLGVDDMGNEQ